MGRTLLLYQMPKAGSQTVEATLAACGIPHHMVRLHYLSEGSAQRIQRCISKNEGLSNWAQLAQGQIDLQESLVRSLRLRRLLCACRIPIPKLQVITAVRDVIGAALSSIFQNYHLFAPTPEELTAEICRDVLMRPKMCPQFQEWFDAELRPHIGIDVYQQPFRPEQGHVVYTNRMARVLLYRFEALPGLAPVLADFMGCEVPALSSRNVASTKEYAVSYRRVSSTLSLPADFVRVQHESKMMRHFYSAAEREALQRKWCGSAQTAPLAAS